MICCEVTFDTKLYIEQLELAHAQLMKFGKATTPRIIDFVHVQVVQPADEPVIVEKTP